MQPELLADVVDGPLSEKQMIVLRDLIDLTCCTKKRLIDQLYGGRRNGGYMWADSSLRSKIMHIRRKLRKGARIEFRYEECYILRLS